MNWRVAGGIKLNGARERVSRVESRSQAVTSGGERWRAKRRRVRPSRTERSRAQARARPKPKLKSWAKAKEGSDLGLGAVALTGEQAGSVSRADENVRVSSSNNRLLSFRPNDTQHIGLIS